MTRVVIFADDIRDRIALFGRLREITGESVGELRQRVDKREPFVDYDTYSQSGYREIARRLRQLLTRSRMT